LEQGYLFVYARSGIETLSAVFDPADVLDEFTNPPGIKTSYSELLDRIFLSLTVRDSKIVFGGTSIDVYDLWFAYEFRRYMMNQIHAVKELYKLPCLLLNEWFSRRRSAYVQITIERHRPESIWPFW
jgi:hypothetical protein